MTNAQMADEYILVYNRKKVIERELEEVKKELKTLAINITETFDNEGTQTANCSDNSQRISMVKTIYSKVEDETLFKQWIFDNNLAEKFLKEVIIKKERDDVVRNLVKAHGNEAVLPPGLGFSMVRSLRVYKGDKTNEFGATAMTVMEKLRLEFGGKDNE